MREEQFAARARELGFDKPEKYAAIERERRWLCAQVPDLPVIESLRITDVYVDDSQLRLRSMQPFPDGPAIYKFAKKADVTPDRRVITTIYLTAAEYALLALLPGRRLEKARYRMDFGGIQVSVDVFEGSLSGLILAEVEFDSDEEMFAFETPEFTVQEVTDDVRYSGGVLVRDGIPG